MLINNIQAYLSQHVRLKYGQARIDNENTRLDDQYNREVYGYYVKVSGTGINKTTSMSSRLKEIQRCTRISNIEEISNLNLDLDGEQTILLKTTSKLAFNKITRSGSGMHSQMGLKLKNMAHT